VCCTTFQRVAVCCSVLQYVAVSCRSSSTRCSMKHRCYRVYQRVSPRVASSILAYAQTRHRQNIRINDIARCSVLRCIAVCCSVSQCNEVCYMRKCDVLQLTNSTTCSNTSQAEYWRQCDCMLHCDAVCDSVLQCAAACHIMVHRDSPTPKFARTRHRQDAGANAIAYRSMMRCVAVGCSVLQCVAVCCSVLQCVAVCCSVLHCATAWCTATHPLQHLLK